MEYEQLINLIKTVSASSLSAFEMEDGDLKICMEKNVQGQVIVQNPQTVLEAKPEEEKKEETKSKSDYTQDELFSKDEDSEVTPSRYDYDDLYKFYKSGDTEKYEEIKTYLLEHGKTKQQLSSAIKSKEEKEK